MRRSMIFWYIYLMKYGNWKKIAIITEEFKDITNNDMHIIEAIGLTGKTTMSVVAKKSEDHSRLTYDGNECTGQ